MLKLLWDPSDAISDIKQNKNHLTVILTLLVSSLFLGLATTFLLWLAVPLQKAALFGVGMFLWIILVSLYFGLATKITMKGLTGAGDYFSGLSSMVYPHFPFATGMLLSSVCIVWSIALNNQIMNFFFLGLIVLILPLTVCLSLASFYRCAKELFDTNMFTAVMGLLIVKISSIILLLAVYGAFLMLTKGISAFSFLGLTDIYLL
ncbi:hypothetical protein HY837_05090 [archaeon]|nr:hypothetical protein [archaeon]